LLDRIVLTDPDTARALNGYLYGNSEAAPLDAPTKKAMDSDMGDLFADATDSVVDAGANTPSAQESVQALADQAPAAPIKGSLEGAWNFLLVTVPGHSDASVMRDLKRVYAGREVQLRDWRESAGGTALIAWFLRWIFNAGILFIALVSCMILINSLALSILERTREIGTMRALGAGKDFIGGLIAWETLLIVVGAGVVGIALGALSCGVLSALHLKIDNVYLSSLFGGHTLDLQVTWQGLGLHLVLSVVLGLVAIVLPIRRALAIDPVKAIARDQ
jgi:ABC-type antimicrobial peptide transport system permease subunit